MVIVETLMIAFDILNKRTENKVQFLNPKITVAKQTLIDYKEQIPFSVIKVYILFVFSWKKLK